jgi:hypothetical protein
MHHVPGGRLVMTLGWVKRSGPTVTCPSCPDASEIHGLGCKVASKAGWALLTLVVPRSLMIRGGRCLSNNCFACLPQVASMAPGTRQCPPSEVWTGDRGVVGPLRLTHRTSQRTSRPEAPRGPTRPTPYVSRRSNATNWTGSRPRGRHGPGRIDRWNGHAPLRQRAD